MAEFYSARGWEIPPLPWTNLSPPFSTADPKRVGMTTAMIFLIFPAIPTPCSLHGLASSRVYNPLKEHPPGPLALRPFYEFIIKNLLSFLELLYEVVEMFGGKLWAEGPPLHAASHLSRAMTLERPTFRARCCVL